MLIKKYYNRDDVKRAGFSNLKFYGNKELNLVFLDADLVHKIARTTFKITFTVENERLVTSQRNIEILCRKMLLELDKFMEMKSSEQKEYAEQKGEKIKSE